MQSDQYLANEHHSNSLEIPSLLLVTAKAEFDGDKLYSPFATTMVRSDGSRVSIPLPWLFESSRFVGSCNDIVCVTDGIGDNIYLFNLLIGMFKKLPCLSSDRYREKPFKVDVVFGYDCVSRDFKVLRIKCGKEGGGSQGLRVSGVEVYSLIFDSWREIRIEGSFMLVRSFVSYSFCPVLISGPVLNGVLYLEGANEIVTFDLRSEVFGLILFPDFMKGRKSNVLDIDGSLAVVVDDLAGEELSLWTMETVSGEVFWKKMIVFDTGLEIDWVFVHLGAKQFFVTTKSGEMLYDHSKKETKYVALPPQSFLTRVLKHAESFISIEGFEPVEENWM